MIPFVQQAYFVDACLLAASIPSGSAMDAAWRTILPSLIFRWMRKGYAFRSSRRRHHGWESRFRAADSGLARPAPSVRRLPRMLRMRGIKAKSQQQPWKGKTDPELHQFPGRR